MTLAAGSRLGPYEILAPLGAGGMGEVYRARDTRLGREVAIKVLPAAFASDVERLSRFEREARSASALSHPNIIAIYDVGSAESVSYIAMELVSGKPLRALLGGALPMRRLLQIAAQVADGLSKAHSAGIVHRDLKPENVMLTEDGLVKILDFGLAKVTQSSGAVAGPGTSGPTLQGETDPGMVMGTVGYMSPEQALGRPIDFRSDQFSLGAILYEMATGRRAFQRESAPQSLTAIIQDEPEPIAALNPRVPTALRWIVDRCLAKEARNRYASTEDCARDLAMVRDHLSEATSAVSIEAPETAKRARWRWLIGAVTAVVVAAVGIALWQRIGVDDSWRDPLAGARYTRFTDWEGAEFGAALSADGKFVAFISDRAGQYDVWVSQVGGGEFLNLTKGQSPMLGNAPFRKVGFSDDGAHVWWPKWEIPDQGDGEIWRAPTIGGTARRFLSGGPLDAQWSPDRTRLVLFKNDVGDPIFTADPDGGGEKQLFPVKRGMHHHYPTWSPDGRFVYFVQGLSPNEMDIWRASSQGGDPERLTFHNAPVSYLTPLGPRIVAYVAPREDRLGMGLWAMDVERRIPHAVSSGLEEYLSLAATADGRRLAATVANPTRNLWLAPIGDQVADDSRVALFNVPSVNATWPRFGPGYLVYISSKGGTSAVIKLEDSSEVELWKGSDGAVAEAAAVSADGTRICLTLRRGDRAALYLMESDGTRLRPIAEPVDVRGAPSWSPDGEWIAIVANESGGATPLLKVPAAGGAPVRLLDGTESPLSRPVWSPDGRIVLYSIATKSAGTQLRGVTPDGNPASVPDIAISYLGAAYRFLPDSSALVFMQGDMLNMDFWLLDLSTGGLRQLTALKRGYGVSSFDVSPDGKQILFDRYRQNSDIVLIDLPPRE
jgi:Tol biopolymer transport system component